MPRYIDAEKLKEDVMSKSTNMLSEWDTAGVLNVINSQEPADVAPVRHGEWLFINNGFYECSECGADNGGKKPYCWKCGAKMDGKEGDVNETSHLQTL